MKRVSNTLTIAFLLSAGVSGCATMSVSSHVRRGLDMTRYRTYDWGTADALPAGDPRLDRHASFNDHVQRAVDQQLAARGLERSLGGSPDLLIHYHASIAPRLDVNRVEREFACSCTHAETIEYESGTLVLDVVDARTHDVIWRGWAQDAVEGVLDNPDKMERHINDAVTRMLATFPAASSEAPLAGEDR